MEVGEVEVTFEACVGVWMVMASVARFVLLCIHVLLAISMASRTPDLLFTLCVFIVSWLQGHVHG
jgi:hypothetical protein